MAGPRHPTPSTSSFTPISSSKRPTPPANALPPTYTPLSAKWKELDENNVARNGISSPSASPGVGGVAVRLRPERADRVVLPRSGPGSPRGSTGGATIRTNDVPAYSPSTAPGSRGSSYYGSSYPSTSALPISSASSERFAALRATFHTPSMVRRINPSQTSE